MPWLATEVLLDNMLKADEMRTIKYNTKVKKGDELIHLLFFFRFKYINLYFTN